MTTPEFVNRYEILKGEQLKSGAERVLQALGGSGMGQLVLEHYAFGMEGRIEGSMLQTSVAGIDFENPVGVGAGWDKKGTAVQGLYGLGFGSVEVGTVPMFGQPGNAKPRLWTIDRDHSVGLNRMGFNALGAQAVKTNLERHGDIPGVVGVNVGRNKDIRNEHSVQYHADAVATLLDEGDYFVFNPSSPNTEGLRDLQAARAVTDHVEAICEQAAGKPVLVKLAPDLSEVQIAEAIEAAINAGAKGAVLANTTISPVIKALYGERWAREAGGISGDDPTYRRMTTEMIRFVYEEYGDQIDIIGVGGVKDSVTAMEKILAGASMVQVVTAIRPTKGKVAANILRGMASHLDNAGVESIRDLIGADTVRGPKPLAA